MKTYIKVFKFIKKYQPYSVYLLLFIFIFSSLIEALGISLVMPLIALVLDTNFIEILGDSSFGKYVPNFIFSMERNEALFFFSVSLIFLYLTKNIILIFTEYYKFLFTGKINAKLSNELMNKYLHQNYLYHSKKSSSEINSIINQKINDLTNGMFAAVLTIISEIVLILVLILLIIFFKQFNTFLILISLFFFGAISGKIINKYIKQLGIKRKEELSVKFDNFNRIINNFREILLIGKTGTYFKNFQKSLSKIAYLDAVRSGMQRSPQLILETVGISGLILIIYYLLNLNSSPLKIIAVCTFFAAVSYRAIPSIHKILYFHYNVKYYDPIFVELVKEIDIKNNVEYHNEKFETIDLIKLKNISFQYQKNKDVVLDKINLEFKKNQTIGIFGDSGSGKTTLLDIFTCLVEPITGNILVNDTEINSIFLKRKFQNNISYTSQKTSVLNDSLIKNICFGVDENNIDYDLYKESLKIAELENLERDFNINSEKMSDFGKNISGGQLQRIGIARAFYQNKDILIFDEATNALDENLEEKILSNLIKLKKGKIIIFISHNLKMMKEFDEVYKVSNKNINKVNI